MCTKFSSCLGIWEDSFIGVFCYVNGFFFFFNWKVVEETQNQSYFGKAAECVVNLTFFSLLFGWWRLTFWDLDYNKLRLQQNTCNNVMKDWLFSYKILFRPMPKKHLVYLWQFELSQLCRAVQGARMHWGQRHFPHGWHPGSWSVWAGSPVGPLAVTLALQSSNETH